MNDNTKNTIRRAIRDTFSPSAGLMDVADLILDDAFIATGWKDRSSRKQYFEMTSKRKIKKPIKYMTIEQFSIRNKVLVMIKTICSYYNNGNNKSDLMASLHKQNPENDIVPLLLPWIDELFSIART